MHLTNCPEPRLDHRRINLPTQEVNVLSGNVGTDWWRGAVSTCPTYFGKQSNSLIELQQEIDTYVHKVQILYFGYVIELNKPE